MRTFFLLFFITGILFRTQAQTDSLPESTTSTVFTFVEQMPALKNKKYKTFDAYAKDYLVVPADAKAAHVTGMVYVIFIVETDGSLSNIQIIKGRGLHPSCDKAALDLVSKSQWNPGMHNGKPVPVKMIVKVPFK